MQIGQVILNLALNAMDAMQGEPIEDRLMTIRTARDGDGQARVSITDTGPGIASDQLAHVFEPLLTTNEHGMGLGLAISRTIIEAHSGHIQFALRLKQLRTE